MSLFGSLMGDFEDDPIFGSHMRSMRHMNNMMNSMFDPFGMMGGSPALTGPNHQGHARQNEMQMMPFGFPPIPAFNMNRMFSDFENMGPGGNGNCHSFMSRSVMSMTSGPDGRPQVYQASSSTTTAPGGIKETKKSVCDSRTGLKKLAIGHHIGERAHIYEREHNLHSGEQEEHQEYINLEEEEAEDFNKEWEHRTKQTVGAIDYNRGSSSHGSSRYRSRPDPTPLALPAPSAPSTSRQSSRSRWAPSPRRALRSLTSPKPSNLLHTSRTSKVETTTDTTATAATTTTTTTASPRSSVSSPDAGSRKRDRSPDEESSNKRCVKSNSSD